MRRTVFAGRDVCRTFLTVLLLLAPLDGALAAGAAEDPCGPAYAAADLALAGADLIALEQAGLNVAKVPSCDANRRTAYRRRVARELAARIVRAQREGGSATEARKRLVVAERIAPVWQVLVARADLDFAEGAYAEAGDAYNRALNDMSAPLAGDPEPLPDVHDLIYQRASEIGMLAPALPPAQRDGSPGGVDATLLPGGRGDINPRPRLMPVTYVFGQAIMTHEGEVFAGDWLDSLRGAAIPALVLVGHTDKQGVPALNETLSLRRAQALAAFLRQRGFSGAIATFGYGQRCPIAFTSSRYTEAERNTILRRVEVVRGTDIPADLHCTGGPIR